MIADDIIKQYGMITSECSCSECQEKCKSRVCWGTPDQIEKLIDLGYTDKLMYDYWAGDFGSNNGQVGIICPAMVGYEGKTAPFWPHGKCCMYNSDGKCIIHEIKPLEGVIAGHDKTSYGTCKNVHELVAKTWDTTEGRRVVEKWYNIIHRG